MDIQQQNREAIIMGETFQEKIEQLVNYGKMSSTHPLKIPIIEKQDIPSYINCPK